MSLRNNTEAVALGVPSVVETLSDEEKKSLKSYLRK